MWPSPQNVVTFSEEIPNRKLHFFVQWVSPGTANCKMILQFCKWSGNHFASFVLVISYKEFCFPDFYYMINLKLKSCEDFHSLKYSLAYAYTTYVLLQNYLFLTSFQCCHFSSYTLFIYNNVFYNHLHLTYWN